MIFGMETMFGSLNTDFILYQGRGCSMFLRTEPYPDSEEENSLQAAEENELGLPRRIYFETSNRFYKGLGYCVIEQRARFGSFEPQFEGYFNQFVACLEPVSSCYNAYLVTKKPFEFVVNNFLNENILNNLKSSSNIKFLKIYARNNIFWDWMDWVVGNSGKNLTCNDSWKQLAQQFVDNGCEITELYSDKFNRERKEVGLAPFTSLSSPDEDSGLFPIIRLSKKFGGIFEDNMTVAKWHCLRAALYMRLSGSYHAVLQLQDDTTELYVDPSMIFLLWQCICNWLHTQIRIFTGNGKN